MGKWIPNGVPSGGMCASKSTIRITAAVAFSFRQKLPRECLFNDFFSLCFILVFNIFKTEEGFLLFANAAGMGISNKAIVRCVFTLGPLINLVCFLIEAFVVEGMIAIE